MKKSWNIINEMMKRSKKSNNRTDFDLTSNGHLLKNPENALNEHYANIAAELSKKFTKSSEWKRTLTNPVQNSVFFYKISTSDVIYAAQLLKPKTSSGHDDIPAKIVISTIFSTAPILAHLINTSIDKCIFPKILKLQKLDRLKK